MTARRWIGCGVITLALVGCRKHGDRDDRQPPAPAGTTDAAPVVRVAPTADRNAALRSAPFDYQLTAEPCHVPYATDISSPDVVVFDAADIDTAPPSRAGATAGHDVLVIDEVRGADTLIGRIYVWDRTGATFVCATAFNLSGANPEARALATSKVFKLIAKNDVPAPDPGDTPPVRVGRRVLDVAVGESHFCAVADDGSVRCFGQNDMDQCGTSDAGHFIARPQTVPGVKGAVEVSVGDRFSCARSKAGAVRCWGSNGFGELGGGDADASGPFTPATGKVTQIAAGSSHVCALRADGTVVCWGQTSATRAVQKDDVMEEFDSRPRPVAGLAAAKSICSGNGFSCATLRAGGIRCWGAYGATPVAPPGADDATAVMCTSQSTAACWLDSKGTVGCHSQWKSDPLALTTGVAWLAVRSHSCALMTDATVKCWGSNEYGEVGDGTTTNRDAPVGVRPLRGVKKLAVGVHRTAAILADDGLVTWGYGPIGDGRDCQGPPCDGLIPTQIPLE